MNTKRDADAILGAWLDDGPLRLPDDIRRAIAVGLRTTPQRRGWFGWHAGSRRGSMFPNALRLAMAFGAVVLVAIGAFAVWQGQLSSLLPAASPDPSPTASPFAGPAPAGTPDAGNIAYVSQGRIQLVDPTSGNVRALTPELGNLVVEHVGSDCISDEQVPGLSGMAWSPDGGALAFFVKHSCGRTLFAVSSDGTTLRVLLDLEQEVAWSRYRSPLTLDWSPDGSQIAVGGGGDRASLLIVSLDGAEPVDLGTACPECSVDIFASVDWSPDGAMIAARLTRPAEPQPIIAVVDVATGAWTTLWEWSESDWWLVLPLANAWLPDGSLAIWSDPWLYAVHPANPQQPTALEVESLANIVMSPNGSRLAAAADGLLVTDVATGESTQIADWSLYGHPVWSPDGSQIAAVRGGGYGVWVVDADGSNARQVAQGISVGELAWQPVWP